MRLNIHHLWSHIFWLCFASGLLGFVVGDVTTAGVEALREWVGALSGWIAAIAAFLTVRAIYKQIEAHREETNRYAIELRDIAEERAQSILKEINRTWKLNEDLNATRSWPDSNTPIRKSLHYQVFYEAYDTLYRALSKAHISEIEQLTDGMLPRDKSRFTRLIFVLQSLQTSAPDHPSQLPDPEQEDPETMPLWQEWPSHLRWSLGDLGELVRDQFPTLYPIIKNRTIETIRDVFDVINFDDEQDFSSILRDNNPI